MKNDTNNKVVLFSTELDMDVEDFNNEDLCWAKEQELQDVLSLYKDKTAPNTIVAFGEIGHWRGPIFGAKLLTSDINSIFHCNDSDDDWSVWVEDGEVRGDGSHHDGRSLYTFRVLKDDEEGERLYEMLYYNQEPELLSEEFLMERTESLAPYLRG